MRVFQTKLNSLNAVIVAVLCIPALGVAQQPKNTPSDSVLEALVAEVHQMRVALERSSTLAPRVQLAVTRVQMLEDRIDREERELRAVRVQLNAESLGRDRLQRTLRQAVEARGQEPPNLAGREREDSMRFDIEQVAVREQLARAQEAEIAGRLKADQVKLQEFAQQLERLEKAMQP